MEQPDDPGLDPFPSIFSTEVFVAFLLQVSGLLEQLDQCMFGGLAKKSTTVAHTLEALTGTGLRCSGDHVHGASN